MRMYHIRIGLALKKLSWGIIPRELKEDNVRDFLTIKKDSLIVHEYGLKFTQLSRYAPKMVTDMRSTMS